MPITSSRATPARRQVPRESRGRGHRGSRPGPAGLCPVGARHRSRPACHRSRRGRSGPRSTASSSPLARSKRSTRPDSVPKSTPMVTRRSPDRLIVVGHAAASRPRVFTRPPGPCRHFGLPFCRVPVAVHDADLSWPDGSGGPFMPGPLRRATELDRLVEPALAFKEVEHRVAGPDPVRPTERLLERRRRRGRETRARAGSRRRQRRADEGEDAHRPGESGRAPPPSPRTVVGPGGGVLGEELALLLHDGVDLCIMADRTASAPRRPRAHRPGFD